MSRCFATTAGVHFSVLELYVDRLDLHSFPTRRSSDLGVHELGGVAAGNALELAVGKQLGIADDAAFGPAERNVDDGRSEEHTSELQSLRQIVCRLLLVKKKTVRIDHELHVYLVTARHR